MNLKERSIELKSEALTVAASNVKLEKKPCVWPMLYSEINGNADDIYSIHSALSMWLSPGI